MSVGAEEDGSNDGGLQARLDELLAFLHSCRWCWDYHLLDVLTQETWQQHAPAGWLEAIAATPTDGLIATLLQPDGPAAAAASAAWPPDLRAWAQEARRLSLPRLPCSHADSKSSSSSSSSRKQLLPPRLPWRSAPGNGAAPDWMHGAAAAAAAHAARPSNKGAALGAQRPPPRGVKAKKQHELAAVAELVALVAAASGATLVVDIGAGKGHLANELAGAWGLDVLAVEGQAQLSGAATADGVYPGAQQQPQQQEQQQQKRFVADAATPCRRGRVLSVAMRLEPEAIDSQLAAAIEAAMAQGLGSSGSCADEAAVRQQPPRVVLTGLHACGDLTPPLLSLYQRWPAAVGCVSIGCCYNLLSEAPAAAGPCGRDVCSDCSSSGAFSSWQGWPFSDHLRQQHHYTTAIGRFGRLLACQSTESSLTGTCGAALGATLRQHALRAGLQLVLVRQYPEMDISGGVSVGRGRRRRSKRAPGAGGSEQQQVPAAATVSGEEGENGGASRNAGESAEKSSSSSSKDESAGAAAAPGEDEFLAYVASSLKKLGLPPRLDDSALHTLWREARAQERLRLLPGAWWLRMAVAPVLESALLLDRLLFLREGQRQQRDEYLVSNGVSGGDGVCVVTAGRRGGGGGPLPPLPPQAVLLPLFDPQVSPRNVALVAVKALESACE